MKGKCSPASQKQQWQGAGRLFLTILQAKQKKTDLVSEGESKILSEKQPFVLN